jgi:hypothetical protein
MIKKTKNEAVMGNHITQRQIKDGLDCTFRRYSHDTGEFVNISVDAYYLPKYGSEKTNNQQLGWHKKMPPCQACIDLIEILVAKKIGIIEIHRVVNKTFSVNVKDVHDAARRFRPPRKQRSKVVTE